MEVLVDTGAQICLAPVSLATDLELPIQAASLRITTINNGQVTYKGAIFLMISARSPIDHMFSTKQMVYLTHSDGTLYLSARQQMIWA